MSKQSSTKRGKITPEHQKEAQILRAMFEARRPQLAAQGIDSQAAFGERFEIGNQGAVWQYLQGRTALSMKAALGFCRGLGCRLADFSPRLDAEARELIAKLGPALGEGGGWPFPDIEQSRWRDLSETQRIEIQGIVRDRLERFEQANAGNAKAA